MCKFFVLLACLAFSGLGQRLQTSAGQLQKHPLQEKQGHGRLAALSSSTEARMRNKPLEAFASLLLAFNSQIGSMPLKHGARMPAGNKFGGFSTRRTSRSMTMQEEPEKRRDSDGGIFTAQEFEDYYGEGWIEKWEAATPAADIKMIKDLMVGDEFPNATVIAYTDSAAFMEIGAEVNGYLHYSRIPQNIWDNELDADYVIKCTIEKINVEKGQIALTTGVPGIPVRDDIKYLDQLKVGDVIEDAYVKRCTDFGAFMDIGAETDALCHVSKIPYSLWDELDNGHEMKVIIEKIDIEKGQIGVREHTMPEGKGKGRGRGGRR